MTFGYETREAAIERGKELSATIAGWRMAYPAPEGEQPRWVLTSHLGVAYSEPQEARYISPEGEVLKLVHDLPPVHIEDLWDAAEAYRQAQVRAMRNPATFEREIAEARAAFMVWCRERGLPIDFTPR